MACFSSFNSNRENFTKFTFKVFLRLVLKRTEDRVLIRNLAYLNY